VRSRPPLLPAARRLGAALLGLVLGLLPAPGIAGAEPGRWWDAERATGDWRGLRGRLAERGVEAYARYATGFLANLRGGFDTGIRYEGFASWGLDFDLERMAGWRGAGVHVGWHSYHGGQASEELIGVFSSNAASDLESAVSVRFFEIFWRQDLLDGALRLRLGQLASDEVFFASRYAAALLNAAFGDFSTGRARALLPFYPLAAPGVDATLRLGERWTLRAGAYTADAGDDTEGNWGFGWSFERGASFVAELTAELDLAGRPGSYGLGALATTARVTDFETGRRVRGSWRLYAEADQALLRDATGATRLGAFVRAAYGPSRARAVVRAFVQVGLSAQGPIPGRERDVLALGAGWTRFGADYVASLRADGENVSHAETFLELTYRAALTRWLSLQPDLHLVFDPHQSRRDAVVLGLRLVIDL
jgi:porin